MRPVLYIMSDTKISEVLILEDLAAFIYSDNYNEVGRDKCQKSECVPRLLFRCLHVSFHMIPLTVHIVSILPSKTLRLKS